MSSSCRVQRGCSPLRDSRGPFFGVGSPQSGCLWSSPPNTLLCRPFPQWTSFVRCNQYDKGDGYVTSTSTLEKRLVLLLMFKFPADTCSLLSCMQNRLIPWDATGWEIFVFNGTGLLPSCRWSESVNIVQRTSIGVGCRQGVVLLCSLGDKRSFL